MLRFVLVGTLATGALAACGGDAQADPSGRAWLLTELNGQPPIEGAMIDLSLSGNEVSGSSGCNSYFGSATVGDGEITLGPNLAGTMMACADDVMAQEQTYLNALSTVTGYEISGDELRLLDAGGTVVARFE